MSPPLPLTLKNPTFAGVVVPILSLFVGTSILVIGTGLFFTALGLRAGLAQFPTFATGLVMSAYFVGFVAGTFVCPAIIRRVGHIRAFAAMASTASTTAIVHAMVIDPWVWSVLRAITGLCLVGLYMVIESWLSTLATNQSRGRIFATYGTVTLTSMGVGQFLILAGDIMSFVPLGLVSILISLALVPIVLTRVSEPKPIDSPRVSLGRLYSVAPLGTIGALGSGLLSGALLGMGAVFAQRVGFDEVEVAAYMAAAIFGGAALQWPIGYLSDHRDRRSVLTGVCVTAGVIALGSLMIIPVSHAALIATAFLYGGLAFSIYGLSVAVVNDNMRPGEVLEATVGLLLLHGVGAALGPAAAGVIMDTLGPGSLLVYFAIVLFAVGAFGLLRLRLAPGSAEPQHAFMVMADASQVAVQLDPRASADPGASAAPAGRGESRAYEPGALSEAGQPGGDPR